MLLECYRDVAERVMAMPVRTGRKTAAERFAGAEETLTIEGLMRDRKALQAGTSHYLGQNFSRTYGVTFLGRDGEEHFAEATSWGVSTRLVGGLIMAHGDDAGLRLPPAVAPIQVVIVPIYRSDDERSRVLGGAQELAARLRDAGFRVKLDDREEHRPGFKFAEWELRGVPVRIELGPRDLDAGQVTIVRRDQGVKAPAGIGEAVARISQVVEDIQRSLFDDAKAFADAHTFRAASYDELLGYLADPGGFVVGGWCGSAECETKVKEQTKATIRYLPLDPTPAQGRCIVCGATAAEEATWAVAY
jgi:prolyl-tRNA synthetase